MWMGRKAGRASSSSVLASAASVLQQLQRCGRAHVQAHIRRTLRDVHQLLHLLFPPHPPSKNTTPSKHTHTIVAARPSAQGKRTSQ